MFDEKKARRVIRFIECLRHTKGEFNGKPFKLLPWQEKIIRDDDLIHLNERGIELCSDQVYKAIKKHL